MKKILTCLFISAFMLLAGITAAQLNYLHAIKAAQQSEGSDQAIETVMQAHGFNLDACDPAEPTTGEKFRALIKANF